MKLEDAERVAEDTKSFNSLNQAQYQLVIEALSTFHTYYQLKEKESDLHS